MSKNPFPVELYFILQTENPAVISWDYGGASFRIHDHRAFCTDILPRHFRHSKFPSFQRQLNFYRFQKDQQGPRAGSYFHPEFTLGNLFAVQLMRRKVRKNSKGKICSSPRDHDPSGIPTGSAMMPLPSCASWSVGVETPMKTATPLSESIAGELKDLFLKTSLEEVPQSANGTLLNRRVGDAPLRLQSGGSLFLDDNSAMVDFDINELEASLSTSPAAAAAVAAAPTAPAAVPSTLTSQGLRAPGFAGAPMTSAGSSALALGSSAAQAAPASKARPNASESAGERSAKSHTRPTEGELVNRAPRKRGRFPSAAGPGVLAQANAGAPAAAAGGATAPDPTSTALFFEKFRPGALHERSKSSSSSLSAPRTEHDLDEDDDDDDESALFDEGSCDVTGLECGSPRVSQMVRDAVVGAVAPDTSISGSSGAKAGEFGGAASDLIAQHGPTRALSLALSMLARVNMDTPPLVPAPGAASAFGGRQGGVGTSRVAYPSVVSSCSDDDDIGNLMSGHGVHELSRQCAPQTSKPAATTPVLTNTEPSATWGGTKQQQQHQQQQQPLSANKPSAPVVKPLTTCPQVTRSLGINAV